MALDGGGVEKGDRVAEEQVKEEWFCEVGNHMTTYSVKYDTVDGKKRCVECLWRRGGKLCLGLEWCWCDAHTLERIKANESKGMIGSDYRCLGEGLDL